MTKADKLKKIIEYAVERGYDKHLGSAWIKWIKDEPPPSHNNYYILLFDHDFAKAVFGEGMNIDYTKPCPHCGGKLKISNPTGKCSHIHYPEACDVCSAYYIDWADHLQQAVISKDPINYYYQYIKK